MDQLESKLQDIAISKSPTRRQKTFGSRSKWKAQAGCWNCGEASHLSSDCTKLRKGGSHHQDDSEYNRRTLNAVSHASDGKPKLLESCNGNIPTFSVSCDSNYILEGLVNGVPANMLADTGAAVTVMSKEFWDRAKLGTVHLEETVGKKLVGVQETPLELHGTSQVEIELQGEKFTAKVIVAGSLTTDIILGRDFLKDHQCSIEMGQGRDTLRFHKRGIAVTLNGKPSEKGLCCVTVTIDKVLHIPPRSEMEVIGQIPPSAVDKSWVLEGVKQGRNAALVARAVVQPHQAEVPLRFLNIRDETVTIPKCTTVAELELLPLNTTTMNSVEETSLSKQDQHDILWEMALGASNVGDMEREQLFSVKRSSSLQAAHGHRQLSWSRKKMDLLISV